MSIQNHTEKELHQFFFDAAPFTYSNIAITYFGCILTIK